jgi:hypothetical protein
MKVENNTHFIYNDMAMESLSKELIFTYNKISEISKKFPSKVLRDKIITRFEKHNISVINMLSYLIGWSSMLVSWYEMGKQNKIFTMPGEGFSKWEYEKIASHFYEKYKKILWISSCHLFK